MRISRIKNKRGSIVVLVSMSIILMVGALALIIDIGRIALARARLQAAVDRAAYAGAASLAHSLNNIAVANWEINKAFRYLDENLTRPSEERPKTADELIDEYNVKVENAQAKMNDEIAAMQGRAENAASAELSANFPQAQSNINVRTGVELNIYAEPDEQWKTLNYGSITGGSSTMDPADVETGSYDALKYMKKKTQTDALVGIYAEAKVQPLMLRAALGDSVAVYADSAGEAYGGPIEGLALRGGDSVDDAASIVEDDRYDSLYRAAIVPMWNDE